MKVNRLTNRVVAWINSLLDPRRDSVLGDSPQVARLVAEEKRVLSTADSWVNCDDNGLSRESKTRGGCTPSQEVETNGQEVRGQVIQET
jgi:hypothetical protein